MKKNDEEWKNADYWLRGRCSTFAAAFRRRFGGELWAIVNHSRKYCHDELVHCYCVLGGVAYDAAGGHTIEEVSNISAWKVPDMDRENDVIIQWQRVDEAWLERVHEDYARDQFPEAWRYVGENVGLFREAFQIISQE